MGSVMTAHGFRSKASTLLSEQQAWHPDAIERQLAHAPRNKVRAACNHAEHLTHTWRLVREGQNSVFPAVMKSGDGTSPHHRCSK